MNKGAGGAVVAGGPGGICRPSYVYNGAGTRFSLLTEFQRRAHDYMAEGLGGGYSRNGGPRLQKLHGPLIGVEFNQNAMRKKEGEKEEMAVVRGQEERGELFMLGFK